MIAGPGYSQLSFSALLKHERRIRGVSQEVLASRAGYTSAYISMLERGERAPTAATVELLAAALDAPPESQAALLAAAKRARKPRADAAQPTTPEQILIIGGFLGAAPESALIARGDELAAVESSLTAAMNGMGRMLMLAGDPGVGKTRLAQEIAMRARERGAIVATGRCYAPLREVALAPFSEALILLDAAAAPALRATASGRWPQMWRLMPAREGPDSAPSSAVSSQSTAAEPPESPLNLYWQITSYIREIAAERPVALLFDDLHWADDASLGLIQHLARHTRDARVWLLGVYRESETHSQRALREMTRDLRREGLLDEVRLGGLTREASLTMMTATLTERAGGGATLAPAVAERIYEATGGLPLFLREILKALLERGELVAHGGSWSLSLNGPLVIPETVRDAISERVERLSPLTQSALRAASVLGPVFARASAQQVSGLASAELTDALEEALLAGLLQEQAENGAEYGFNHALTQRAIYEAIPIPRRRQMHWTAGEALKDLPPGQRASHAAEVARHFLQGDDAARALPFVMDAMEYAARLCAWSELERHAELAVDLARELGDGTREAVALERLALALMSMARYDEAITAFDAASAIHRNAGDLSELAWTTAWTTRPYASIGRADEGLRRLLELVTALAAVAGEPTPEQRRDAFRALAYAPPQAMQTPSAVDDWRKVTERATGILSYRSAARVYLSLSANLFFLARLDTAIVMGEQAVAFARKAGDQGTLLRALVFYGLALWPAGQVATAIRTFEEARDTATAAGDLEVILLATNNLAGICEMRGEFARAAQELERTDDAAERFGAPEFTVQARLNAGQLAFLSGRWDEARRLFTIAEELGRQIGVTAITAGAQASAYRETLELVTSNTPDEARARLERTIERLGQAHDFPLVNLTNTMLAEDALLNGRGAAALEWLTRMASVPEASDVEALPLYPLLAWATADQGDIDGAARILNELIARAATNGHALALVDALRIRALLAVRLEHWQEAAEALEQALALARPMPHPYAVAKALGIYGLLHERKVDLESARARYHEALAVLSDLGERLYATHFEQDLARLG